MHGTNKKVKKSMQAQDRGTEVNHGKKKQGKGQQQGLGGWKQGLPQVQEAHAAVPAQ
jgi:hypothetical protein